MVDIVEILIHWYAGRSQHELSASLGVDRKTARKYVAPAVASGLEPGGPPMTEADWRRLVVEWFPELSDARLRQVSWPVIEAHRDYIAGQLAMGVTVATVHQRLVDEHGLAASVASVRRWVRANLPEDARRAQVTVLRDTPPPGQEAQIDYGRLGMWTDPRDGRRRTVWAFVMVLAHSRHMFVRPTLVMDQAEWTAAHAEAFAFFGGVPARLVPDYVPRNIVRHEHPEDPAEEPPGLLAAGDDLLQRHRERQIHEHVPGEAGGEHQRPQLPPLAVTGRDQPQIPEIDLHLTARRPVIDPRGQPLARRPAPLGHEPVQRPLRHHHTVAAQQDPDLHHRHPTGGPPGDLLAAGLQLRPALAVPVRAHRPHHRHDLPDQLIGQLLLASLA